MPAAGMDGGWLRALSRQGFCYARSGMGSRQSLEPLLGDYRGLHAALAYQGRNNHTAVLKFWMALTRRYPDSLQSHDAACVCLGADVKYPPRLWGWRPALRKRAAAFLEKHRQPVKSDIEVTLAAGVSCCRRQE